MLMNFHDPGLSHDELTFLSTCGVRRRVTTASWRPMEKHSERHTLSEHACMSYAYQGNHEIDLKSRSHVAVALRCCAIDIIWILLNRAFEIHLPAMPTAAGDARTAPWSWPDANLSCRWSQSHERPRRCSILFQLDRESIPDRLARSLGEDLHYLGAQVKRSDLHIISHSESA